MTAANSIFLPKTSLQQFLDISELSHRLWLLGATKIAYKLAPVTSQFFLFYLQVIKKDKAMI